LCVFVAISPSYAATELKDEGTHKGWVTSIDCTGAGIDCSALGIQGTVNVPGGGSGEICFVFSNDTSTLTAGQDVVIPIPYNITVSSSEIVADISGSATAQIYMCDYATYNISAAHKNMTIIGNVTLTADYKSQDTTLSNWDKTLDAKSYVRCNLTSIATIKSLTVTLFGNYTGD